MNPWPRNPLIYEINTWVWLEELGRKAGHTVSLASVPDEQWDRIAALGFNAVWLMGVWERSPAGVRIAMANQSLVSEFRRALPDFSIRDNVGSPYCIRHYIVDGRLGGTRALAVARKALARRGMGLLLDYVPNHVAPDHPWVRRYPDRFILGEEEDLEKSPDFFLRIGKAIFACGRDPHYPAWPDVVQLNAFSPALRWAAVETLSEVAGQCDGVRCDMAMLVMNGVFKETWGKRAGALPREDFWAEIIPAVKNRNPGFRFLAEAYWDLERELQLQGFDYCYDKRLYDRLAHGPAESVHRHLQAGLAFQEKMVRFIENHDEQRAAAFGPEKHRAMAVAALTLPGARLVHGGQLEGRRVRLPLSLARHPMEPDNPDLQNFYGALLAIMQKQDLSTGTWQLCHPKGWPDNKSFLNLVSWCWRNGPRRCLIVVNLSDTASQGLIQICWEELKGRQWPLRDAFTSTVYERGGDEMAGPGIYVDLPPWGFHFFEWRM